MFDDIDDDCDCGMLENRMNVVKTMQQKSSNAYFCLLWELLRAFEAHLCVSGRDSDASPAKANLDSHTRKLRIHNLLSKHAKLVTHH